MGNKRNALLMHTILCMNLQGIIMIKNQSPKVRSLFRLYNPFHLYNLFKHGKIIELDNRLVTVRAREGTGAPGIKNTNVSPEESSNLQLISINQKCEKLCLLPREDREAGV